MVGFDRRDFRPVVAVGNVAGLGCFILGCWAVGFGSVQILGDLNFVFN